MKFGRDYDLKKIPANEPAFLLRAQDKFAADVVRFYANLVHSNGGDPEVVKSVFAHADTMQAWPTKKGPDL